jgi:hypothetical protein
MVRSRRRRSSRWSRWGRPTGGELWADGLGRRGRSRLTNRRRCPGSGGKRGGSRRGRDRRHRLSCRRRQSGNSPLVVRLEIDSRWSGKDGRRALRYRRKWAGRIGRHRPIEIGDHSARVVRVARVGGGGWALPACHLPAATMAELVARNRGRWTGKRIAQGVRQGRCRGANRPGRRRRPSLVGYSERAGAKIPEKESESRAAGPATNWFHLPHRIRGCSWETLV